MRRMRALGVGRLGKASLTRAFGAASPASGRGEKQWRYAPTGGAQ